MIILALDTTAVTASVALLEDSKVIASFSIHNKLTHSEKILPMIDSVLCNSGYTVDDLDLIGVSVGPGSFTGVRIGVSTAKGLAFARNLPIVPVSALEALSENFRFLSKADSEPLMIAPSMDARRNELYNAVFSYDGKNIVRITPDRAISVEEFGEEFSSYQGRMLINGDGAQKLYDYLSLNSSLTPVLMPEVNLKQNAVSVGTLAYKMFLDGKALNSLEIAPLYLRTSQAERVNKN